MERRRGVAKLGARVFGLALGTLALGGFASLILAHGLAAQTLDPSATLVSLNSAGTGSGNGDSFDGVWAVDGSNRILFRSLASDLDDMVTDPSSFFDVFVRDLDSGETTLVSLNSDGSGPGNGDSSDEVWADDGSNRIMFRSSASDLDDMVTDTNSANDVFVRDLDSGETTLVSVNSDGTGSGNGFSSGGVWAVDDSNRIMFHSDASDLDDMVTDTNSFFDVFVVDLDLAAFAIVVLDVPCPIYDSTTANGLGLSGSFAGDETRNVSVTGSVPAGQGVGTGECVPDGATAAVVTISAIDPQGSGNLRLSAAGVTPNGGVVNYAMNTLNNANTVTVPLSASGQVDIFANVSGTDVRLVAVGYTSDTTGLRYTGVTPCAVADSRENQSPTGDFVGPFESGDDYPDIDVVGTFPASQGGGNIDCGVPDGADAVMVNLVAVNTTGGTGFLSVATAGLDPFEPATPFADLGTNNSASAIIALQGGDEIAVDIDTSTGTPSTHVRVVILGYFDDTGDDFVPLTGCAAFDTRSRFGGSGPFLGRRQAGSSTTYQITGAIPEGQGGEHGGTCEVPTGAKSVLINLVAVQPVTDGNFRAYATASTPTGGVVNYGPLAPSMNNSNAVVIPLSTAGQFDLYINTNTNDGTTPSTHARGVVLGYYK
ncbi:MAG: hypothetical protein GY926_07415 [bacterium]|nr:hypothetical protein [bacterium]